MTQDYRIDLKFVPMNELTQIQSQLNQWKTKGELIKFETQVIESGVFFKILRTKGE